MFTIGLLIRIASVWTIVCFAIITPGLSESETSQISTALLKEDLAEELCGQLPRIGQIKGDYAARPLTFGEGITWVNKALFGSAKSPVDEEKYAYTYQPDVVWEEWQKGYLEEENPLTVYQTNPNWVEKYELWSSAIAIKEYSESEKDYWWKPKKHVGTTVPSLVSDDVWSKYIESYEPDLDNLNSEYLSSLAENLGEQFDDSRVLKMLRIWRNTYCTLWGISHEHWLVGLPEAYEDIKPDTIFILSEDKTPSVNTNGQ